MAPTPLRLFTDPSGLNVTFEIFEAGVAQCGVLVTLNSSARTCRLRRAPNPNSRNTLRSRLGAFGPRKWCRPPSPKRACVTDRKGVTSKYCDPAPTFPSSVPYVSTAPLMTRSGYWVLVPGAVSTLAFQVTG